MRLIWAASLAAAACLAWAEPALTPPSLFLQFGPGERYSRSHEIVDYFRHVDSASDRVVVREHGRSWEGRPLIHAIISSPRNLARLEEIRLANRQLVFSPEKVGEGSLSSMPLVIWLGAGVHGNEASGPDAALQLLHFLAEGKGVPKDLFDKAVIILDPNMNPDGRERFVGWQNAMRGQTPTPDSQDYEHSDQWPAGRTNHYWFDLNRDWLPLVQIESQQRHKVYTSWRPQVTLDYHEMALGLTYFFQPGVASRVHPLTPRENQEWTQKLASFHARALERLGERYFTGERFDDFYPGKGSTYPDLAGSVGILFEQSSSRGMATQTERELAIYSDRVRNQLATMKSSLEGAMAHREGLLQYQKAFFSQPAPAGQKSWLIRDTDEGRQLVRLLQRHEIVVQRSSGGFLVPGSQPLWRLVEAAFNPLTEFEDTSFYDISVWALPLASEALPTPVSGVQGGAPVSWDEVKDLPGQASPAEKPLGWIIRQGRADFHRAVYRALKSGARTFFVKRSLGGAKLGDVFVSGSEEPDWAKGLRVAIQAVPGQTGQVTSWGGSSLTELSLPRIALAAGTGADLNNTGEMWHHLDVEMGIPVSVINPATVTDLSRYSVILLAGGTYPASFAASLQAWVRDGGTLVASATGATWVTGTDLFKLSSSRHQPKVQGLKYGEIAEERSRHVIPGTAFRLKWDETHPLSFGASSPFSFREGQEFWEEPATPGQVVARYGEEPLAGGYLSEEVKKLAAGKPAIVAAASGRGHGVLLADNPLFRGFFLQQRRVFLNALFFSEAF